MIDPVIDRVDAFALRYRKSLMFIGGLWMMVSWASAAHFISLPEIPLLTGTTGIIASSVCAALWWGFVNSRIMKRRAARAPQSTDNAVAGAIR